MIIGYKASFKGGQRRPLTVSFNTRGKVEEIVTSRVVCSRLVGAIAPMLEQKELEQLFLNKAMALCQDTR